MAIFGVWTSINASQFNGPLRQIVCSGDPYIRDEEILDSIKTHVLKKVARIGRLWRFTWRVRCELHRRFCRSS